MASISPNKSGGWSIQWYDGKSRPTVYLGQCTKAFATDFKRHLEDIVLAKSLGEPINPRTSRWLAELPAGYRAKLAQKGLIAAGDATTVRGLCAHILRDVRAKFKGGKAAKSTLQKHRELAKCLTRYFPRGTLLRSVSEGDAEEFRSWLELGVESLQARQEILPPRRAEAVDRCQSV